MAAEGEKKTVRVLCPKKKLFSSSNSSKFAFGELKWLIGSPLFLPQFTVISSLRCLHFLNDQNPNFQKESDEIRTLLLRGLNIVGALIIISGGDYEEEGRKAVEFTCELRKCLFGEESCEVIGGVADSSDGEVRFFRRNAKLQKMEGFGSVVYEEVKEDWLWEGGCLLRCEMGIKVPVYVRSNGTSDFEESSLTDVAAKLRDPHVAYLVEGRDWNGGGPSDSIVFHGVELDFKTFFDDQKAFHTYTKSNEKAVSCSFFCSKHKCILPSARDNADVIQVTVFSNQSRSSSISGAPIAQYVPASDPARLSMVNLKLDVLCYASKEFPVTSAISKLIIPGLVDQIISMKRTIQSKLLEHNSQLCPYHFLPSGFLHPITTIYDLRYGETEVSQGEIRKALHERLGLPLDRPLLRTANALNFGIKAIADANLKSSSLLKDVHTEIPSSGVSGGVISLIDGSYEYYHYLLNGIDDSGWGCAYRSLQTIISWFKLQHYTSVRVPSHREIQQALVEIGDKEPAFVGSHDWIGAIELSFVLDKLLGVSCKIMNVRSGEELPEKCRELAMHFEMQGTPIMIGGGVLAYTLLGVDYNEASGDCAFLILDPHYTGNDDLKKIVSGGWCGWKKAVDSKGRNFFLKDKFYNLLLPQRPNMV